MLYNIKRKEKQKKIKQEKMRGRIHLYIIYKEQKGTKKRKEKVKLIADRKKSATLQVTNRRFTRNKPTIYRSQTDGLHCKKENRIHLQDYTNISFIPSFLNAFILESTG